MKSVTTLPERMVNKIMSSPDGCWLWTGGLSAAGYAYTNWPPDHPRAGTRAPAHRVIYSLLVSPVPDDLHCDHLCRVRSCVNPRHVEPVTQAVNSRRGAALTTHCPRGHAYSAENTGWQTSKEGWRMRRCRTCHRDRERERYHRNKASR